MTTIALLQESEMQQYDNFLLRDPETLFFASSEYRGLLQKVVSGEAVYFVAKDLNGEIEGVLPSFLFQGKSGPVLNSLPFYGSNGGAISLQPASKSMLIRAFLDYAHSRQCISSTIVTSPLEKDLNSYLEAFGTPPVDERIGQITMLPGREQDTRATLMSILHQKTRNMVRKAERNDLRVEIDNGKDALDFLKVTHMENMKEIGGLAKSEIFFEALQSMTGGLHYNIFTAAHEGRRVAALLLFYFNKTVEYFTPVIVKEFRSLQPMTLLVFEAMIHAVEQGFSRWNWGGTWKTQEGVYLFKSRWGTEDKPYYYFTKIYDESLFSRSASDLRDEYPGFYLLPFRKLTA